MNAAKCGACGANAEPFGYLGTSQYFICRACGNSFAASEPKPPADGYECAQCGTVAAAADVETVCRECGRGVICGRASAVCDHCDGTGTVEIETGGNGYAVADVPTVCGICDGSGRVEYDAETHCAECDGTGRERCETCDGTGRVSSVEYVDYPETARNRVTLTDGCETCDGTGRIPCNECDGTGRE